MPGLILLGVVGDWEFYQKGGRRLGGVVEIAIHAKAGDDKKPKFLAGNLRANRAAPYGLQLDGKSVEIIQNALSESGPDPGKVISLLNSAIRL